VGHDRGLHARSATRARDRSRTQDRVARYGAVCRKRFKSDERTVSRGNR
jgi:hypothetical protein